MRKTGKSKTSKPVPRKRSQLSKEWTHQNAIEDLNARVEEGKKLKLRVNNRSEYQSLHQNYEKWDSYNYTLLERIFTTNQEAEDYIPPIMPIFGSPSTELKEQINELYKNVEDRLNNLNSIINCIHLFPVST